MELNPDTEVTKNILGETTFHHNGYEETSEASPYYARTDSVLSVKLQEIIDNRYKDDNCRTKSIEVHLWEENEDGNFVAWMQDCYIVPSSYGGDTSGYQTPFTVNYVGGRTRGVFDRAAKTFTADSGATPAVYLAKKPASGSLSD